jgi:hypothetical protein
MLMLLTGSPEIEAPCADLLDLAERSHTIFATEEAGMRFMGRLGRKPIRLHCGYSRLGDRMPRFEQRDIDLVIHVPDPDRLGATYPKISGSLHRFEHRVISGDGGLHLAGPVKDPEDVLRRTKVFVALGGRGSSSQPVVEAMLSGCAVVASHGTELHPLRDGEDLLFAEPRNLLHVAGALLSNSTERLRLASHAYMTLRLDMPLRRALASMFAAAEVARL